ncbi:hypothetical protein M409DRAFT_69134 [Zasmidium cellare ATCC 36951]|uniref:Cytokinin riboside 5'-monophosphate phosphoribohydrolase n=1 Tax=Zasmidium cellare ATCC 36951 TaxID=1080233 RepID=A0A6A6CAQ2_ZASCE|nr:uncharacterized protein M409DRAFT_69134 [Zasmidium cellare ATCC 36951]KAF2162536.1 hypothetical protein M409DRAFT_69134 [Zasmidium cellare ATCC 36951]
MSLPQENGTKANSPVVCVFCGSAPGTSPAHISQARALAQTFHQHGIKLVFGGGTSGVMGALAAELVRLSGPSAVHGVIPTALIRFERNYDDVTEKEEKEKADEMTFGKTTRVPDMHTRKQTMVREVLEGGPGSGFVALSGGYGTLEELMEITTWNQLGIHDKPIVIFNVEGYWEGLLHWIQTATEAGFVRKGNAEILVEAHSAEDVVERLRDYETAGGRLELDWEK